MIYPPTIRCFRTPAFFLLVHVAITATTYSQESAVDFTRDVRPILSNTCFHCHGPDENAREADLRLDLKSGLFGDRGGYVAVKAGDVSSSELVKRILSHDPDEVMPPSDSTKTLTHEQRRILVDWVRQGAVWKQHWSFTRPTMPAVPTPRNPDWCRNEIDRFVLKKMQAVGLVPSERATAHTLLRRLYLDLIGLPPTLGEADSWLTKIWGDPNGSGALNEAAWQDLISYLMSSPHYGERWARRWLDLARYADTNGYEKDRDRSIWPYRDWVLTAINDGMPFDRFTVEQLAGDMLPDATISQRIATGFHRNTMLNEEGGIDPLEFRFHAMTDRVATTGTTWLGLTLGCCQCHTHKYDPISHHEYYQIFAYLNNADEPSLELPDKQVAKQWETDGRKAKQLIQELPSKWPVKAKGDSTNVVAKVRSAVADGKQVIEISDENWVSVRGANPDAATYVVDVEVADWNFNSIRLTTGTGEESVVPGRTKHGNFVLSEITFEFIDGTRAAKLPVKSATATAEQSGFDVGRCFDGNDSTGWAIHTAGDVPPQASGTFQLDLSAVGNSKSSPMLLRITMKQIYGSKHTIGTFQFSTERKSAEQERVTNRKTQMLAALEKWRREEIPHAVEWTHLKPVKATSNLPILTIQDDDSIFASGDTAKRDDYFVTLAPSDHEIAAIRLEALPDIRLPSGGPGSTYYEGTIGDFYLTEISARAGGDVFPFSSASHTYAKNRYGNNPASATLAIDGDVQTGWSVHGRQGERHVAVFVLRDPVPARTALTIQLTFGRHFASSLGRFRFSATDAKSSPQAREYSNQTARLIRANRTELAEDQNQLLQNTFLMAAPEMAKFTESIRKLQKRSGLTSTLVFQERPVDQPRPTFRHHRGEYLQPKDQVQAGLPSALASDVVQPRNRLEFARWIVSEANPLTARVVVNRHWEAFFGTGIVKTVDDFGLQGESPSHPQLLDWLALTFSKNDRWSVRELHRRIVSSETYRQSAAVNPEASSVDPDNRLLSYSPRFRLDAEILRDQLLVAAGVLSRQTGGPPVRPPQPGGVTEAAYGKPKWKASSGSDRYRRSLYTFAKRTAPFAMFSTFDAPSGEACIARRNRSNSPLQALTLLNDVMLMDLARQTGLRLAESGQSGEVADKVELLFRRVLVRPPAQSELKLLTTYFANQLSTFEADTKLAEQFLKDLAKETDTKHLAATAAWAATARAVFGLDEALTRE